MNSTKNISIIGATGNLGVPVTKFLVKNGYSITVIARDIAKAKRFFCKEDNIKIVYGDLKDVDSLRESLSNTEYLYLNLSSMTTDINIPFVAEREGIANIVKAVNPNVIKQIIAISGLGAFQNGMGKNGLEFIPNIIRKQGHKILKDSGIPYTILHCSWFMDSFILFQRKGTYAVIGNAKDPVYFTNAFDFTQHLSNAIGNETTYYKEYPIQGKQGINHPSAAKEFLSIYSAKTKVQITPTWLLKIFALLKKEMKIIAQMAEYFGKSVEQFQAEEFNTYRDLGQPNMTISQYAQLLKKEEIYDYLCNA